MRSIQAYEIRIGMLKSRTKRENGRIVRKLERKIRAMKARQSA